MMLKFITSTENLSKLFWFGFLLSYCAYTTHWPSPFFLREYTVPIYLSLLGFSFLMLYYRALPLVACLVIILLAHMLALELPNPDLIGFFRYAFLCAAFFVMGYYRAGANEIEQVLTFLVGFSLFVILLYFVKTEVVSFYDYGQWRLKGWFSEPSAVAILSGLLIWSGMYSENRLRIALGLILCLFSYSIINVLVCSAIVFFETKMTIRTLLAGLLAVFAIFLSWELFSHTNERLIYLYGIIADLNFTDFLLKTNKRTNVVYYTYLDMNFYGYLWSGYGVNQEAFGSDRNLTATLGLAHLFLKSFGILGVVIYFLLSVVMVLKFKKTKFGWILVFVIYATINSAHGLLLQSFWFYGLGLLSFKSLKSIMLK